MCGNEPLTSYEIPSLCGAYLGDRVLCALLLRVVLAISQCTPPRRPRVCGCCRRSSGRWPRDTVCIPAHGCVGLTSMHTSASAPCLRVLPSQFREVVQGLLRVGPVFAGKPSRRFPRGGAMSPMQERMGGAGGPAAPWGGEGTPWLVAVPLEPPLSVTDV